MQGMRDVFKSITVQKIAGNTFFQLAGKVVSMSITILATIIITRTYGRFGYGEFSLMQNYPALFFILTDFGLNAIAARDLSKDWSKAQKYYSNIFLMRLVLALVFILISACLLAVFPYSASLKLGINLGLFVILTQALFATTNVIFQVKLRYDLSTIGYVAGSLFVLLLVLVLSYFKADIMWVNFSYIVGGVATFFINSVFLRRLGVQTVFEFDRKLWSQLILQSLPLGLMFIFSQINFKADSMMISVMKLPEKLALSNTDSVAIYGLPYKVFEVCLVVPTFFMNTVYPVLVRHMVESKVRLQQTFLRALGALFACGVVMALLGFVFAPLIIRFLGGASFIQSVDVLRILLGGIYIFCLTQPIAWLIVTLGYQKFLPWVYLVSAVFNVSANYIFIPRFSFYGSAVITLLSEFLILIMLISAAVYSWNKKYARAE